MLLVLLDGRLSWVSNVPYLRASVVKLSSSSVPPFRSTSFSSFVALNALSHFCRLSQRSFNGGLTVSVRLDLSTTLTPP